MIAAVAIDTNAYSGFRRGLAPMVAVLRHVPRIVVPLVVAAELLAGFEAGARAARNREEFSTFLGSRRVVLDQPDLGTAEAYARVYAGLRKRGTPIPTNDLWVAATAIRLKLPLVTLDGHFAKVEGLRVAASLEALLA
jgi:predicted nucleic acid-binding protein